MKYLYSIILTLVLLLAARPVQASDNIFTTTVLLDFVSTAIVEGTKYGFDLYDYIHPIFTKMDENAYVDFEPFTISMEEYGLRNEPGTPRQNGKIVDHTNSIRWYSLYGAILKTRAEHGTEEESPECYISHDLQESSDVEFLPTLDQHLEFLSSIRGLSTKELENGVYDFNYIAEPLNGMKPGEDCKKQDLGDAAKPLGNNQVRLSTFGAKGTYSIWGQMLETIYESIKQITTIINGITTTKDEPIPAEEPARNEVKLTKKTKQNGMPDLCYGGSQKCISRNMEDRHEEDGLHKTGGVFAGFVPENLKTSIQPNGMVGDEVKLAVFDAGKFDNPMMNFQLMEKGTSEGACLTAPSMFQDKAVMGDPNKKNAYAIMPWCRSETTEDTAEKSVCATAEEYGIPCCQLEGIMAQETGTVVSSTNELGGEGGVGRMGSATCTAQPQFSCCNDDTEEAACGPAQVLCGQYGGFAGTDKPNLCTPEGSAVLVARAMLLKLCQAAGQCGSYDWASQKNNAMKFKDTLETNKSNPKFLDPENFRAAGYFYGMNQGCVASGCTQYRWGAGKTYCDPIIEFCQAQGPSAAAPALQSTAGPFQEFCLLCKEEDPRVNCQ